MSRPKALVHSERGGYFMMAVDDFRFADLARWGYTLVAAEATVLPGYVTDKETGRRVRVLVANGRTFHVFVDWSAKEILR
jgi:hypothetical protein